MIAPLALGLGMFVLTLFVLTIPSALFIAVVTGNQVSKLTRPTYVRNLTVIQIMAFLVALTHLANIGLWAALLCACGEFASFDVAYYHSAVNYSSLGYGDLIMSTRWRLLGPLETIDGIVKVGISTALMFALLQRLIERRLKARVHDHEPTD